MITLAQIDTLAKQSFQIQPTGDAYADERHEWVADPANKNKEMWWGKKQPYYVFLFHLAKEHHGGMALEVGTHQGIAFAHLAAGANASKDPRSWTVGIDKTPYHGALQVQGKYHNCEFLNGVSIARATSSEVERICRENKIQINIIFLDATHTLKWVNAEINTYTYLFSDQIVIVMDDCFKAANNTNLPECYEALPGQKAIYPNLHTENCVGISLTSRSELEQKWRPKAMEVL